MQVFRICRAAFVALDGVGAETYGGRWNSPGRTMVYTASAVSLAVVEALVNVDALTTPDTNLVRLTIAIPDAVTRDRITASRLPTGWQTEAGVEACRVLGDAWLKAGRTAILEVPSAPVPEEVNVLINPVHADARLIRVVKQVPFTFDTRLV